MFSVIICTHNPNVAVFLRMLESINQQTLDANLWEWIIVDNSSARPVISLLPENLKERIKVVEEKELGLTPARLSGINMATNPWLVFVDDDNILASDFLQEGQRIIYANTELGAFGGALHPEFVREPSPEVEQYLFMLAIRQPSEPCWGKSYEWDKTPFGAGLFIKKSIAEQYVSILSTDNARRSLDRKGASLMSSGDIDMAHTAVDLGYAIGVFPSLQLVHVIPAVRVTKKYLLKMMRYNILSNHLLFYIRFGRIPTIKPFWKGLKQYASLLKNRQWFELGMHWARYKGTLEASKKIKLIRL